MKFSLRFNNDLPVHHYPPLAQAAESAGFDQFWVSDDLFLRGVWPILSACAVATRRIGLGTCIVNPYTMHPAEMAMQAAALDELSNGRFNLGLAAGAAEFLGWVGLAQPRPLATVEETMHVLQALFAGEQVQFSGEMLRGWTKEAYLRFPSRPIPVYLGAMSAGMLRLTGRMANGGLPLLFPPEHYAEVRGLVEAGAQAAGRTLTDLDLAACIWVSVAEDQAAAEAVLRDKIAYYGSALSDLILQRLGVERAEFAPISQALQVERNPRKARALVNERMLRIGIVGTANSLIERLEGLVAMGADHLSFGPPLGPDPLAAVRLLGERVIPHFRK